MSLDKSDEEAVTRLGFYSFVTERFYQTKHILGHPENL